MNRPMPQVIPMHFGARRGANHAVEFIDDRKGFRGIRPLLAGDRWLVDGVRSYDASGSAALAAGRGAP